MCIRDSGYWIDDHLKLCKQDSVGPGPPHAVMPLPDKALRQYTVSYCEWFPVRKYRNILYPSQDRHEQMTIHLSKRGAIFCRMYRLESGEWRGCGRYSVIAKVGVELWSNIGYNVSKHTS